MKYQLFPELNESEYAELKADIEERGVMVPLEYDEEGNLLDGHHRKRICDELGITDFPTVTREGMSEQEKRQHVRKLNIARRHLSKEQRNQIIKDMRAEGMSERQISEETGVSQPTVHRVVSGDSNESPDGATVTGKDGKTYPATKQRSEKGKPGGVSDPSSHETPVSDGPATSEPAADSDEEDWYDEGPFPEEAPAPQSKPDTEQEFRTLKSKTVKTLEAGMRCFDDLHRLRPRLDDIDWALTYIRALIQSVKNW